jgi:hypothetical protein
MFATPGADAAQAFDIANIHFRDPLGDITSEVNSWKTFFAQYGDSSKPLWVTETDYPSDPAYQEDPAFHGTDTDSGLFYQAAYIKELVPTLLNAGVAKIFVTERDNLTGEAAAEGLIGGDVTDADADIGDIDPVLKPSFAIYQQLAQAAMAPAEYTPPTTTIPAHKAVKKAKKVCKTKTVKGKRKRVCRKAHKAVSGRAGRAH